MTSKSKGRRKKKCQEVVRAEEAEGIKEDKIVGEEGSTVTGIVLGIEEAVGVDLEGTGEVEETKGEIGMMMTIMILKEEI
mmetsp:Transcript_60046/g.50912  ORF Transcript_60046/g.50912 Transcript_60046/m.50912 type:complete len:80 (+) Transcript_60046:322-561(+)